MLDHLARLRLAGSPSRSGPGWLDRAVGLLTAGLVERRLRALVLVEVDHGADRFTRQALVARLRRADGVQWVQDSGLTKDVLLMLDCAGPSTLAERMEALLAANPTVRRFESFTVGRELRFTPLARLAA
jgi:hypothetical protein